MSGFWRCTVTQKFKPGDLVKFVRYGGEGPDWATKIPLGSTGYIVDLAEERRRSDGVAWISVRFYCRPERLEAMGEHELEKITNDQI